MSWIKGRTGPPDTVLASVERAKAIIEKSEFTVPGLFPDIKKANVKNFLEAPNWDNYPLVLLAHIAEIAKYKPGIIFLKGLNEGTNDFGGEATEENITKIVNGNYLPLIVELNKDTAQKIFSDDIKCHSLMFISTTFEDYANQLETVGEIARDYRWEILFFIIDTDRKITKEL